MVEYWRKIEFCVLVKSFQERLDADRETAFEKGYTFAVAVQDGQGMAWDEQASDLEDLKDAFILVNHLKAWKDCIFLYRDGCGYEYWNSHHPGVLNSDLLTMEIRNS